MSIPTAILGGEPTFAEATVNGEVAPIPAVGMPVS
jgi:hypothetical protein